MHRRNFLHTAAGLSLSAMIHPFTLGTEELSNTVMVLKLEFDRALDEIVLPESPFDGDSGWIL